MYRWHNERSLMLRRWKEEMGSHRYDWRNPPTDPNACHCAQGIGSMRKRTPQGCGNPRCGICHYEKFFLPKARATKKRAAISYEREAEGGL